MANRHAPTKGSPYARILNDHIGRADELPLDRTISGRPHLKKLRRAMLRTEEHLQRRTKDKKAFIRYADLKSRLCDAVATAYFDEGYLRGEVVGAAELRRVRATGRALVRSVVEAGLQAGLSQRDVAVALLNTARAFIVGSSPGQGHRASRRRSLQHLLK
jgi:hypothetical protein